MLSFAGSLKVWVWVSPCDMRRGFEGLAALVSEQLKEDLRSGALFVFCNKRRTIHHSQVRVCSSICMIGQVIHVGVGSTGVTFSPYLP